MAEKNTPQETTTAKKTVAKKTKAVAASKKRVVKKAQATAKPVVNKAVDTAVKNATAQSSPSQQGSTVSVDASSQQSALSQASVSQTITETNTAAVANQAPVAVKSGRGLSTLALLCSLAALGLSGYLVYENTIKRAAGSTSLAVGLTEIKGNVGRISDVVTDLQGNVQTLGDKQSAFMTNDAVTQQVSQQLAPVVEQQTSLNETVQKVRQQVSGDDSQYVFDRVRRLLETANTELNLSGNASASAQALTIAADQIQSLNNNSLDVVRGKILADIEALAAIEQPDFSSISSKLLAMQTAVEKWPLQNEPNAEVIAITSEEDAATQTSGGFVDEVKRMASQVVKDAIKVQKIDAAPKPLLAPEQRYFLNQNLRLQLLTAQNAMLQQESVIYKSNLEGASNWIKEYFDPADARVKQALDDLSALAVIDLTPSLHDISGTLKSFNDVANSNITQR